MHPTAATMFLKLNHPPRPITVLPPSYLGKLFLHVYPTIAIMFLLRKLNTAPRPITALPPRYLGKLMPLMWIPFPPPPPCFLRKLNPPRPITVLPPSNLGKLFLDVHWCTSQFPPLPPNDVKVSIVKASRSKHSGNGGKSKTVWHT